MLDPSFFSGVYGRPRVPGAMYQDAPDQGFGGYSGSGTYTLSPDNSVPTSAVQPGGFQGFLSSLQGGQQRRQGGGLIGAIGAAKSGGLMGLGKFLI